MDRVKEILANNDQNFILNDKRTECFKNLLEGKGDLRVSLLPVGYGKSVIYHLLPQPLEEQLRHGQKPRTKAKTNPVVLSCLLWTIYNKTKRDDFQITNFLFLSSNIQFSPVYDLFSLPLELDLYPKFAHLGKCCLIPMCLTLRGETFLHRHFASSISWRHDVTKRMTLPKAVVSWRCALYNCNVVKIWLFIGVGEK